ncbi:Type III pantothenate kinase [Gammaproteobacteria bacterium]
MLEKSTGKLLLDIGNSRVKWGMLDEQGKISAVASHSRLRDGIQKIAENCWSDLSPTRVIVSNVAGNSIASELREWIQERWRVKVEFLIPQTCAHGVVNAYCDPSRLGSDRWAALLGAARRQHGHLCVVDCGTAVTMDALSADNIHLGGLIIPGLGLMRDSLITSTAGVRHTWGAEAAILARDTGSAVAGGTLYAVIALIDRVVADLAVELSEEVTVLITGGDGALMAPLLACHVEYQADLVLHGLAVIGNFPSEMQAINQV